VGAALFETPLGVPDLLEEVLEEEDKGDDQSLSPPSRNLTPVLHIASFLWAIGVN
jgi:hypothetical protein